MNGTVRVAVVAVAVIAGSAFSQEFEQFEAKNRSFEGQGGTRKVVDGVDFWTTGSPDRKFTLLGFLNDRRHKSGLIGRIGMANLESDVAKKAKEAGGEAVILTSATAETVGVSSSTDSSRWRGWSQTSAETHAVQKQVSRYAVIRYEPASADDLRTPAVIAAEAEAARGEGLPARAPAATGPKWSASTLAGTTELLHGASMTLALKSGWRCAVGEDSADDERQTTCTKGEEAVSFTVGCSKSGKRQHTQVRLRGGQVEQGDYIEVECAAR